LTAPTGAGQRFAAKTVPVIAKRIKMMSFFMGGIF
jgi:hypothetical protein